MRKPIYTLLQKCFFIALSTLVLLQLSVACKTNRSETASDRKLLEADTAAIDAWELIPGRNEELDVYKVSRKNGKWMVSVQGSQPAEPDTAYLRRSLSHLNNFNATSKLNVAETAWDSLGLTDKDTRLITFKNGKVAEEIILGKMFFNAQNKTTYYVRLKNEDEVYTVQQYLEGSIKVSSDKIRKKEMLAVPLQQISELMFLKPEGVDFVLKRAGQHSWSINSILTNDSTSDRYVRALNQLAITTFGEAPATGADLSIQISTYNGKQVSLRAYRKNSDTWILSSSANTGNYLELPQKTIQQLFPGQQYFMQSVKE